MIGGFKKVLSPVTGAFPILFPRQAAERPTVPGSSIEPAFSVEA